jgi:hypothetical protein
VTEEPQPDPDQGREWVDFIGQELDREYERRDLINSRSAGSISSGTAFVTVSLAVIAVVKGEHFAVTGALHIWLIAGVLLFLLAGAVFGILAGAAKGTFTVAAVNDMKMMLGVQRWGFNQIDARNYTAHFNVKAIQTLRAGNTTKYRFMVLAFTAQALSIFLLGVFAASMII